MIRNKLTVAALPSEPRMSLSGVASMPRISEFGLLVLFSLTAAISGCSHPQKDQTVVEAAAPAGSSLFTRIGGDPVLQSFADQFVRQLALNNKIMSNPRVAGALSKNQDEHKKKLATLLCQISGGPCKYEGRTVKEAHASLKVTQDEWKEMTRIFIQVLHGMKVPKRERQDLAKLVARYKNQIVGS